MPPGYPYNIDSNYSVPMVDENKMAMPQSMIKEERHKESPSPNENPKAQPQVSSLKRPQMKQSVLNFFLNHFSDYSNKNDQNRVVKCKRVENNESITSSTARHASERHEPFTISKYVPASSWAAAIAATHS